MSSHNLYSVHPSVAMVEKWVAELPAKTGRSLDEWTTLLRAVQLPDAATERKWLKEQHGHGSNGAWMLVEKARGGTATWDGDAQSYLKLAPTYVEAMFAKKPLLRPLYEELLAVCLAVGPDAKACPCQTIVPIYRKRVIAEIKPRTRTRIDLGFSLKDVPFTARLVDTGGTVKKDRITHRVGITTVEQIDAELRGWLRLAYERDA